MNVFIAGGTGVLGRRVVRRLVEKGHKVACLSRSAVNRALISELGAEPREGDLFDAHRLRAITADGHAILHLATAIPTHFPSRLSDWKLNDQIRVEGTENLIAAALANQCRVFIAQSITYVYGDRHGAWVDETAPRAVKLGPVLQSALQMEERIENARARQGLPAITLRFGSFYGADAAHTQSMLEMIERGRFPILGDGDTWWNLIQLDDAARAVVAALDHYERNLGETFNIVDGSPVHMHELVSGLANLLEGRRPWHLPLWLARMRLGSALLEPLLLSMRCSNDKAARRLDWQPRYPDFRYGHQALLRSLGRELATT